MSRVCLPVAIDVPSRRSDQAHNSRCRIGSRLFLQCVAVSKSPVRNQIVDYVRCWSTRTELPAKRLIEWLGIGQSRFYDGKKRYGKVIEHDA